METCIKIQNKTNQPTNQSRKYYMLSLLQAASTNLQPNQSKNQSGDTTSEGYNTCNLLINFWTSKGLDKHLSISAIYSIGSLSPSSGWLCPTPALFLDSGPMLLASSVCWVLHYNVNFTFTNSISWLLLRTSLTLLNSGHPRLLSVIHHFCTSIMWKTLTIYLL